MASALRKVKKKFQKGRRKTDDKNVSSDSTSAEEEERGCIESALSGKETAGTLKHPSCMTKENDDCSPGLGLSPSGGCEPGKTTHEMSHSIEHPGSPVSPSTNNLPNPADGFTGVGNGSSHDNQDPPVSAAAVDLSAADSQNPVMSTNGHAEADQMPTRDNQDPSNTAIAAASSSDPPNHVNSEPSGNNLTSTGNQESPDTSSGTTTATAAATAAAGHSQNREGAASEGGVDNSSPQQPNVPVPAAVPPSEDESSLQSLSGPPVQVESDHENIASGEGPAQQEETANDYEHFLVSEEVNKDKFLLDKLALGLDRTSHRLIRNWEHFACTQEVNVPLEVRLRCKINIENSCTMMLFDVVTAEMENIMVKDVIDALTKMKRNDVRKIITDVYQDAENSTEKFSDFAVHLCNSNIIAQMATRLDQKSRVNQYWLHLGQQFKVSSERLKEIEYGQSNPTEVLMEYLYSTKTSLTIGKFYEEVEKLKRQDVLKQLNPFIVGAEDRDKIMTEVIPLESDAMRGICVCLNNPNRVLKNWRHLASAFEIPRDIYKDYNPEKPKSPTESLFEWIFANRIDLTVGQLCSALQSIDRNDIVRDIRKHFLQQ